MLFDSLRDKLEAGEEAAIAGWRWWTGELLAFLPQGVRTALNKPEPRLFVTLTGEDILVQKVAAASLVDLARFPREGTDDEAFASLFTSLPKLDVGNAETTIRMPAGHVLKRNLHLPIAGKRNLREILVLELDRQSPIDPALVYFDYRVTKKDKETGRLDVLLRLVRRDLIDQASRICRSLGLTPLDAEFVDEYGVVDGPSFVIDKKTVAWKRVRSLLTPGLAIATVLFALGAAHAAIWRNQAGLDQLSSEVQRLRGEAQTVEKLRRNVSDAREQLEFLGNAKRSPLLIRILADVTHILPDKSWLFEFEVNGREVRIRGYSPSASRLIELFDNSTNFSNAQFRSPLVQGTSKDIERFDLSFDLKETRS